MTINTSSSELRKFGVVFGIMLVLLFCGFFPWLLNYNIPWWPIYIGGPFAVVGLTFPVALKYPYIGWMKFALVLNWINTRILLGLVYYVMIFPMSMIVRLGKKDLLMLKLNPDSETYRVIKANKHNMENPY